MNQPPREDRTLHKRARPARQRLAPVLKWVGGITAVLSLVFGVVQVWDRVFGYQTRRRHVEELLATGRLQQDQHDFAAAWASDSQAAQLAGDNHAVRTAQEDLAMAWLEAAGLNEGETFAALTTRLTPTLQRGLLDADGPRKADVLAHLGWAEFLRSRDGIAGLEPDTLYRRALAVDPQNVYAHTMLGHWILWRNGSLKEAKEHFAIALKVGRVHSYVRGMERAALQNSHDDAAGDELIRVANDMRAHQEPIDELTRKAVADVYSFRVIGGDDAALHDILTALPPSEHLATFQLLFGREGDEDVNRRYILALLQEAAGARSDALRTLQSLRVGLLDPRLRSGIAAAMRRLSRSQKLGPP